MSFWNGLKSALGFSGTDEEDEDDYDASVPTYAVEKPAVQDDVTDTDPDCRLERRPRRKPAEPEPAPQSETPAETREEKVVTPKSEGDSDDLPGDIFDAVIQLFNSSMPEFVTTSLSLESQRKYIYDRIDASVRARIERLATAPSASAPSAPDAEQRKQLDIAADALSKAKEEIDRLHEEVKKVQSAADRQKRALTDRITDLDRQLSKLRHEKERILTSRKGDSLVDRSEVEAKDTQIKALEEKIASLSAAVEKERTLKEQLEMKTQMSDAMINNLQAEAAKSREELDRANADLAVATEIQEKLEMFEQVKERKDAKIAELSGRVKSLSEELEKMKGLMTGDAGTVDSLRTENASLRRTIETNLYNQANSELKLRNEIKDLKAQLDKALNQAAAASEAPSLIDEPAQGNRPKRRRGRPRKQQQPLEDGLDNTDWLDVPAGSRKFDPDFGYHEPPRRVVPENDAQLSLF